jgi:hypothetical protein
MPPADSDGDGVRDNLEALREANESAGQTGGGSGGDGQTNGGSGGGQDNSDAPGDEQSEPTVTVGDVDVGNETQAGGQTETSPQADSPEPSGGETAAAGQGAAEEAPNQQSTPVDDAVDAVSDAVDDAVDDAVSEAQDTAEDAADAAQDFAEDVVEGVEDRTGTAGEATTPREEARDDVVAQLEAEVGRDLTADDVDFQERDGQLSGELTDAAADEIENERREQARRDLVEDFKDRFPDAGEGDYVVSETEEGALQIEPSESFADEQQQAQRARAVDAVTDSGDFDESDVIRSGGALKPSEPARIRETKEAAAAAALLNSERLLDRSIDRLQTSGDLSNRDVQRIVNADSPADLPEGLEETLAAASPVATDEVDVERQDDNRLSPGLSGDAQTALAVARANAGVDGTPFSADDFAQTPNGPKLTDQARAEFAASQSDLAASDIRVTSAGPEVTDQAEAERQLTAASEALGTDADAVDIVDEAPAGSSPRELTPEEAATTGRGNQVDPADRVITSVRDVDLAQFGVDARQEILEGLREGRGSVNVTPSGRTGTAEESSAKLLIDAGEDPLLFADPADAAAAQEAVDKRTQSVTFGAGDDATTLDVESPLAGLDVRLAEGASEGDAVGVRDLPQDRSTGQLSDEALAKSAIAADIPGLQSADIRDVELDADGRVTDVTLRDETPPEDVGAAPADEQARDVATLEQAAAEFDRQIEAEDIGIEDVQYDPQTGTARLKPGAVEERRETQTPGPGDGSAIAAADAALALAAQADQADATAQSADVGLQLAANRQTRDQNRQARQLIQAASADIGLQLAAQRARQRGQEAVAGAPARTVEVMGEDVQVPQTEGADAQEDAAFEALAETGEDVAATVGGFVGESVESAPIVVGSGATDGTAPEDLAGGGAADEEILDTDPETVGGQQAGRVAEGAVLGSVAAPLQLPQAAQTAAAVGQGATQFTAEAVAEDGPVGGAVESGQAAAGATEALARRTVRSARENPLLTTGTLIGSSVVMGGAAAVSSRAGTASRFAIQPGEELVGLGGNKALRALPGRRTTQAAETLFPDNEPLVLSEESAIRAGRRVAGVASNAGRRVSSELSERIGRTRANLEALATDTRAQAGGGGRRQTDQEVAGSEQTRIRAETPEMRQRRQIRARLEEAELSLPAEGTFRSRAEFGQARQARVVELLRGDQPPEGALPRARIEEAAAEAPNIRDFESAEAFARDVETRLVAREAGVDVEQAQEVATDIEARDPEAFRTELEGELVAETELATETESEAEQEAGRTGESAVDLVAGEQTQTPAQPAPEAGGGQTQVGAVDAAPEGGVEQADQRRQDRAVDQRGAEVERTRLRTEFQSPVADSGVSFRTGLLGAAETPRTGIQPQQAAALDVLGETVVAEAEQEIVQEVEQEIEQETEQEVEQELVRELVDLELETETDQRSDRQRDREFTRDPGGPQRDRRADSGGGGDPGDSLLSSGYLNEFTAQLAGVDRSAPSQSELEALAADSVTTEALPVEGQLDERDQFAAAAGFLAGGGTGIDLGFADDNGEVRLL